MDWKHDGHGRIFDCVTHRLEFTRAYRRRGLDRRNFDGRKKKRSTIQMDATDLLEGTAG